MNKKLGIITIHNSPNYGASLQSFALYYYLFKKGYDCEIIDLARPTHKDFIKSKRYVQLLTQKDTSYLRKIVRKIKTILFTKNNLQKENHYSKELILRNKKFEKFNDQIKLSERFRCIDHLYNNPPAYDVYITGSDQLWNPGNGYAVEPYFLTFVKNGGKKIAYAPSIGVLVLTEKIKGNYKRWLSSYNCLSIREEEGKELLSQLTTKNVEVVLDPTFLLDISYWRSIAKNPYIPGKYIFCFILSKNKELLDYVQKIKVELGLDLIVISQNFNDAKSPNYQFIMDSGPEDFLGLIENAELVFTDSFHATVFSIMLSKNFFSCILPTNRRGSRITNLLKVFSVSDHLLNQDFSQSAKDLLKHRISREEINQRITQEQKKSRSFLIDAIESKIE